MVSKDGKSPDDVLTILLSYIDGKGSTGDKEDLTDPGQVFEFVSREYGEKIAVKSLELAATSDDPEFFVQNLIASSKDELRTFVSRINLEEEGLYNSVDIIKFLINNVSQDTYSAEELFKSLDDARRNRDYNLIKFHELLTREAEGVLKSELVLISENVKDQDDYRSILNYLLNNSEHKNYTRESVYDLLLKLIGIEDVDEFAEKLISYGYTRINNAIADTSLNYFSSPLELIQYLISATQSYDFTSSDINNLLIRMILERGLDERGGRYYQDELKKNFWKSRQFITAVVMVNIVLLILIILFSVRKRRTRSEN